jgi:hypothetical protein
VTVLVLNEARKASAGCQELSKLLNEVDIDIIGLQEIKPVKWTVEYPGLLMHSRTRRKHHARL